jgi:DMSO/TMAO reductase YedYZ molybdopterin-dependent catalytic subunit
MAFLFKGKKLPEGVDPARIPPGQTLTAPDRWPLLHFGPVPTTDIAKWNFQVFGAVENPIELDYGEIRALPSKTVVADIHCVTGWSRLGDTWTGLPIAILDPAQAEPEAKYVMAHCEYGYTTSLPRGGARPGGEPPSATRGTGRT